MKLYILNVLVDKLSNFSQAAKISYCLCKELVSKTMPYCNTTHCNCVAHNIHQIFGQSAAMSLPMQQEWPDMFNVLCENVEIYSIKMLCAFGQILQSLFNF